MQTVNSIRPGRFALPLALALLALSLPAAALCGDCCPVPGPDQTLETRMPCCDEECPNLVKGSSERPGPALSTARPSTPAAARLLASVPALPLEPPPAMTPASDDLSPPAAARPAPLPLRL